MAEAARDLSTFAGAAILEHPALTRLRAPAPLTEVRPVWSRAELTGRLCELTPGPASAVLSAAFLLVRDTQQAGEPAAWIATGRDLFHPPDVAASGIDLAALPVVRAPDSEAAGRAADLLLRSGAFALLVLDLGREARLAVAQQSRLVQLASRHDAAVLCLTATPPQSPSLGSLVSLRATATQRRLGPGRYACEITVLKDKRRGPGWRWQEVIHGPEGLH